MVTGLVEVKIYNIITLYVTSDDHMNKETRDLVSGSSSTWVITVSRLMVIAFVQVEIIGFYFGSWDQVNKSPKGSVA